MDRLPWLHAQPWIYPWKGCGKEDDDAQCKACNEGRFSSCEVVSWSFHGFASFTVNVNGKEENDEEDEDGSGGGGVHSCSRHEDADGRNCCQSDEAFAPNALHLFFAVQPPHTDPAQMEIRVGFCENREMNLPEQTGVAQSSLAHALLVLEKNATFILDLQQIQQLFVWRRDYGCRLCNKTVLQLEEEGMLDKINNCVCKSMPDHIFMKFRHVAMAIFDPSNDNAGNFATDEHNTLLRLMKRLWRALEDDLPRKSARKRQHIDDTIFNSDVPDMDGLVKDVNLSFEQCRTSTDCMCIAAVQAIEVCSADYVWMSDLLNTMAHAAQRKDCRRRHIQIMRQALQKHMQVLEVEEQSIMQTIWGSSVLQQKEKEGYSATLQRIRHQVEQLKDVILLLDLNSFHHTTTC